MIRTSLIAAASLVAASAFAADLGVKKPSPVAAVSAACKETKALPADAFGFSTGSDVADLGAWGAAIDTSAAFGARGGSYKFGSPIVQVSGSFFPCLEVGPYLFGAFSSYKPYAGGATVKGSQFGGGVELKYKLLGRATHGIGLTFAVTPNISTLDVSPGTTNTVYGNSYRLLADAELVKGKLYGAFNLEMFQTWTGAAAKASFFNARLALTTPVTDTLYLGVEGSHQRAYTGTALNAFQGYAWFVGPTFFWQATDKISVNGTWAYQVAGDGPITTGKLNLENYNRHVVRLKAAYAF